MPNTVFHMDSFDFYASADINKHWTDDPGGAVISIGTGRWGTNSMSTSSGDGIYKRIPVGESTHYFGFNHRRLTAGGSNVPIVELRDAFTATAQVTLIIDPAGRLAVKRGLHNGTLLGTGTTIFSAGVDRHVSAKIVISDTVGAVVVKVNGITEINLSGVDTQNHATVSTADHFGLNSQTFVQSETNLFDDFWWNNYEDWGDVRIESRLPSGNGATSAFVGSDGNSVDNYLLVDEANPNSDTDYVGSATPGDIDTYAMQNATPSAGLVKAVGVHLWARKDDGGVRTIAPVVREAGVNYAGANQNIGASYVYVTEYFIKNPATTNDWTLTEVNADEFGVKEVA